MASGVLLCAGQEETEAGCPKRNYCPGEEGDQGHPTGKVCRMQEEPTGDRVVTTYHLLQTGAEMDEPRHLEAGEVVDVRKRYTWSTVRFMTMREGDKDMKEWECRVSFWEDGEDYERTFSPVQDDWVVIRGDNNKLDLNIPKIKVVKASGQRTSWQVMSKCSACDGRKVTLCKEKGKYLMEQVPFKCRRNKVITSLKPKEGGEKDKMAVLRPRMPQLGFAKRVERDRSMDTIKDQRSVGPSSAWQGSKNITAEALQT